MEFGTDDLPLTTKCKNYRRGFARIRFWHEELFNSVQSWEGRFASTGSMYLTVVSKVSLPSGSAPLTRTVPE